MSTTESVEIETGRSPTGSVIWLHGLGADGHDFEPVVPELRLPGSLPLRFVFPHAPVRPVTVNGGMQMRAWYDIVSLDSDGRADEAGIRASSALLDELVAREQSRGIDSGRIVLAGFSQGGAVVLHNALGNARALAGLIVLSSYIALPSAAGEAFAGNPSVPAFMAHGTFDPMVPFAGGRASADALARLGYDVEWHDYPMAHGVCPQEIRDIGNFLLRVYDAG